jgi:hypothetical protein
VIQHNDSGRASLPRVQAGESAQSFAERQIDVDGVARLQPARIECSEPVAAENVIRGKSGRSIKFSGGVIIHPLSSRS